MLFTSFYVIHTFKVKNYLIKLFEMRLEIAF